MLAPSARPPSKEDWLVCGHVAALGLFLPWAFGGQIGWARAIAAVWGLGGGLALAWRNAARSAPPHGVAGWARAFWPLLAFVGLALAGALHPLFVAGHAGADTRWIEQPVSFWWPASARLDLAWAGVALFAGIVVAAANLLWVGQRRALVALVAVLVANATLLAVLGMLQKLLGLSLFLGAALSPNASFFATFIYHNHWSAFALLALAAAIALLFRALARRRPRGLWHSPVPATGLVALVLLATLPLCGSRSGTALGLAFVVPALGLAARRLRGAPSSPRWLRIAVAAVVLGLVGAAIADVARPFFAPRIEQTREQLAALRDGGAIDDRPALYRATAAMIAARPLFGWGPASYGTVFPLYRNTRFIGLHYEQAHSDWLQSLAENGVVGTVLLLGLVGRFLRRVRWRALSPFAGWLLAGCALVLWYAAVEFPFANAAVLALWWTCLFAALREAQLADPVRAAPAAL